jgi:hypothetical protein
LAIAVWRVVFAAAKVVFDLVCDDLVMFVTEESILRFIVVEVFTPWFSSVFAARKFV